MNLEHLTYLLTKVRYQGTEEATFFELGFKRTQAYYEDNKFMFGYIKVGESNTMFTCHLDTVESYRTGEFKKIVINNNLISSENKVLGADNGAGVTLLLHMIEKKIAGHYFFFAGEEIGGIGSVCLANNFTKLFPNLKLERAVAFDRAGDSDVIDYQLGSPCCSSKFATALCSKLGSNYKPAYGTFTDTANFIDFIPECTNVSIGYYNAHSKQEYLDLSYLKNLSSKVCDINWEELPVDRNCLEESFENSFNYQKQFFFR